MPAELAGEQKDGRMTLPWMAESGTNSRKTYKGVLGQEEFRTNDTGKEAATDGDDKTCNDYKLLIATGRVK